MRRRRRAKLLRVMIVKQQEEIVSSSYRSPAGFILAGIPDGHNQLISLNGVYSKTEQIVQSRHVYSGPNGMDDWRLVFQQYRGPWMAHGSLSDPFARIGHGGSPTNMVRLCS